MSEPLDLTAPRTLGRTGLRVGRLGLGCSFGVSRESCLRAFDSGVNYFFWGSVRTEGMAQAIRELAPRHRDELTVVVQCYVRNPSLLRWSVERGLKTLGVERADVLLLGWYDSAPSERILRTVEDLRRAGSFQHLGVSTHHRPLVAELCGAPSVGIVHVRYNAVHPGAEQDVFPKLPSVDRPGIVSFTNTCWGQLLDPSRMPPGESCPPAEDCYRFALSQKAVDVAVCGPKNDAELSSALLALRKGPLDPDEMRTMRRIGQHIRGTRRLSDRLNPLS
jgi:aryl-alcohol dehydrogenase-like predicted oxidoreductase